jgi:hypothetical protein
MTTTVGLCVFAFGMVLMILNLYIQHYLDFKASPSPPSQSEIEVEDCLRMMAELRKPIDGRVKKAYRWQS